MDQVSELATSDLPPKAAAIISFARELAKDRKVMDQKTMAHQLDIPESTFSRYVSSYPQVQEALRPVLPLPANERIVQALSDLMKDGVIITLALIAAKAGISPDTVSRIRTENPDTARRIDVATAHSLRLKIEEMVAKRNAEGLPVTQKWIAEELGVSEASVVNYKAADPSIHRLIEDARPLSAVEKIRSAVEDLKAENIPITIAHVSDRAGIHQATISRARKGNADLAKKIVKAEPLLIPRMTREEAETALEARIQLYGDERCNTATALNRSEAKGGNHALLHACKRLGISLPRAKPEPLDALVSYLKRIADTKPVFEEEAVDLWNRARAGDREAVEELLVRTRPLVTFVIRNTLHEEIDPSDFKSTLIEHLISQGDFIITDGWDKWDGKGGLLWYFGRILGEGLQDARRAYYYSHRTEERIMRSIDAPSPAWDGDDSGLTFGETAGLVSSDLSPEIGTSILHDQATFGEDELVTRRDLSSGIDVMLPLNKQVMAASLKEVFHDPALVAAFENRVRSDWAIFMTGSTGRFGTALIGRCCPHLVILTDATTIFARRAMATIADRLYGRFVEHPGSLPSIIIGRGKDFDLINNMAAVDDRQHSLLRKFVAAITRFGIGLKPQTGFAVIDVATVGANNSISCHIPEIELFFQAAKNGIRVTASREDANKRLIRKLMTRMCTLGGKNGAVAAFSIAAEVLEYELHFLENQKSQLEAAKKGLLRKPTPNPA